MCKENYEIFKRKLTETFLKDFYEYLVQNIKKEIPLKKEVFNNIGDDDCCSALPPFWKINQKDAGIDDFGANGTDRPVFSDSMAYLSWGWDIYGIYKLNVRDLRYELLIQEVGVER